MEKKSSVVNLTKISSQDPLTPKVENIVVLEEMEEESPSPVKDVSPNEDEMEEMADSPEKMEEEQDEGDNMEENEDSDNEIDEEFNL